jgi:hypothetical protein
MHVTAGMALPRALLLDSDGNPIYVYSSSTLRSTGKAYADDAAVNHLDAHDAQAAPEKFDKTIVVAKC